MSPRAIYEQLCREFQDYVKNRDYRAVLRVYNQKSMLTNSNVAPMCGFKNKDKYIEGIIRVLRRSSPEADRIRAAVRATLMPE